MKRKGILIIGPANSGKTTVARILVSLFRPGRATLVPFKDQSALRFLNTKPKCIVFDDVPLRKIETFFNSVIEGICINPRHQDAQICYPKIIVVCCADPKRTPTSASFTERFDVIKLDRPQPMMEIDSALSGSKRRARAWFKCQS